MGLLPVVLVAFSSFIYIAQAAATTSPSWHKYVRAPKSQIVYPAKVFNVTGDVTNADALLNHKGKTAFTRKATSDTVPSVTLDFGQNIVGYPQISFSGTSANHPGIRLVFSESTQYLTNVSDFSRSDNEGSTPLTPGTDQIAPPTTSWKWQDSYGCQYNGTQVCADGLHGFRYMRIELDASDADAPYTSKNGSVSISSVSLNFTALLGTPATYTGWFECSDETLTQYWFDGTYTTEMVTDHFRQTDCDPRNAWSPTLEGKLVLHDGAKRDRDPYVGDIAVSGRTSYLSHNVPEAAKNVIADLADHQRADGWIPPASINNYTLPLFDYPLWWVVTSWDYILYTGDMDYANTYYPHLLSVLDKWYPTVTDSNGLLSKGLNNTSGYGDYFFSPRNAEVTYYNGLYALALKAASSYASSLKHTADASRWSGRATTVSNAINAHLWDSKTGAYYDTSNLTTGVRHSQDGNSLAILSGAAPLPRAQSALNYLSKATHQPYGNAFFDAEFPLSDGVYNATRRVYAFISYFDISARFESGLAESAHDIINRMYGWMAANDPGITMWEGIGPPDPGDGGGSGTKYEAGYTSLAHGWSTGVVSALSNYVLGVIPTGAGFETWSLKPYMLESVSWARGVVPTPKGGLGVSWDKGSNGKFEMRVEVPKGTTGTVSVPNEGGKGKVYVNGKAIFPPGKGKGAKYEDGYVVMTGIGAGTHSFTVSA
ncbi:glycoside hydrolase family 78 protein [Rhizodiscina lignyota]|uniref:Glycoside hydrolase family 78 protein n=1 Tax=Rhizodiscina lignyota TaxID=1504668 RepID=A0A9P4I9J1_9PEZI|nr:glycoside hydrolase family 78 protein [Rhizodiscina lignyota]